MSSSDSPTAHQTSLLYILLAFSLVIGGFFLFSDISNEQAIELIYIFSYGLSNELINKIVTAIKGLPVQLQLFSLMFAFKGIAYLKLLPLVFFCVVTALINARVKKGLYGISSPPSVTAYHSAKKMIPVCLFHLPLIYMSTPVEHYLKMLDTEMIKFIVVSINAFLVHHFFYVLSINKPSKI